MMTAELPGFLYSADQCRELDRRAIAGGIAGAVLMERAGRDAFAVLRQRWPEARQLAILCGGGNNGGDGYVIAALAQLAGLAPQIYYLRDPQQLTGDALAMAQWCQRLAVPMQPLTLSSLPAQAELLVDALLGTGLSGPLQAPVAALLSALAALPIPVLAVDIPSGLNADTGMPEGAVLPAEQTCTFIAVKKGLCTGQGPLHCGALAFADLQVPAAVYASLPAECWRPQPADLQRLLPRRRRDGHKGHYGHVLVVGGERGYAGAPLMSAQAAAHSGAGLTSLATRPEHALAALIRQPEIMVHGVDAAAQLSPLLDKASVLAVGPGLGQGEWGQALLAAARGCDKPMVLDADALNLLAAQPPRPCDQQILTPHPGEAARLLAVPLAQIQADRFAAARALQQRYGGTVLLKGAGTVVVGEPGCAVITDGNPGMASGGMGDVLSGVIAALCAQGLSGYHAAAMGAMVHARAADACARRQGERGMLATDLLPFIRTELN